MIPPVNELRDVLKLVHDGAFDADPDAVVGDMAPRELAALQYAVTEGLVNEREIALTEQGRKVYTIIGGAL